MLYFLVVDSQGAVLGSLLVFILPGIMYLKASKDDVEFPIWHRSFSLAMIMFGVLATIAGVGTVLF